MDPLDAWRDAIERILSEYAAIPYRYGDVRTEVEHRTWTATTPAH